MTAIRVSIASIEEGTEGVIKRLKSNPACKAWNVVCATFQGRKVWLDENGKVFCYVGSEYEQRLKVYINGKLVEVVKPLRLAAASSSLPLPPRNVHTDYQAYLRYYYGIDNT